MHERVVSPSDEQRLRDGPKQPVYHQSISTRLRWSYLISSTLPLLLVGMLLIVLNLRTQQRNVYDEQVLLATQAARDISTYISGIEAQLLRFGQNVRIDTPFEELEIAARSLIRNNAPDIRALTIYDVDGREIAFFTYDQLASGAEANRSSNNLTRDPLVVAALEGQGGRSDIYERNEQVQFTTVVPLRSQGDVIGAISADLSAVPIIQDLRTFKSTSGDVTHYLLNDQFEVVLYDSPPGLSPVPGVLDDFASEARIGEFELGGGQRVVRSRAPVNPINWWVVVEQPSSVAFASVRRSVILLVALVIVVGALALGLGLAQAQAIVRPLRALRIGAQRLGAGDLGYRIDVRRTDEMGQMAHTFNQMAAHLQQSLSEIERQNEHLRSGLTLARDIQMGLLPTAPPWNQHMLAVEARSIPAHEVGGDFYSYLALTDDHAAIAVGDISGKGVAAALLMALTSSMVESQSRQVELPSTLFHTLNDLLSPRLKSNRMNAALVYALFDLRAHTMTVANAGMISPLLIRQRQNDGNGDPSHTTVTCAFVEVGGLPIGAMSRALYQDVTVSLHAGDTVLFLSDGVVEAKNEAGELFGFDRLETLVVNMHEFTDMSVFVTLILRQVQEFMGTAEQHDDITIVAVRPTMLAASPRDVDAEKTTGMVSI